MKISFFYLFGRGERIRTSDPLHPMQVRYQAALRPETGILFEKQEIASSLRFSQ